MTNKCFKAFSKQVDVFINNLSRKYSVYCMIFEKKVAEDKANSVSWGGYQELQYVQEFNKDIREDIYELVDKIKTLADEIERKFTNEQIKIIEEKIAKSIKDIVSNYRKSFDSAMGGINRTIDTSLNLTPNNIISDVHTRFSIYQFKSTFKKDTILFWSIITNLISIISILVTVILSLA